MVAVGNDQQWRRFCDAIGLPGVGQDERFATNRNRLGQYATLRPLLADKLRTRPRAEWVTTLKDAGVPCGAVRDVGEVLQDPQLAARDMVAQIEHAIAGAIRVTGVPVKLSETPGAVRTAPPALGQHTRDVLSNDVGLNDGEIEELRANSAI